MASLFLDTVGTQETPHGHEAAGLDSHSQFSLWESFLTMAVSTVRGSFPSRHPCPLKPERFLSDRTPALPGGLSAPCPPHPPANSLCSPRGSTAPTQRSDEGSAERGKPQNS